MRPACSVLPREAVPCTLVCGCRLGLLVKSELPFDTRSDNFQGLSESSTLDRLQYLHLQLAKGLMSYWPCTSSHALCTVKHG